MEMAELNRKKDEKINGVIYDMSPSPGYSHFLVTGNIYHLIRQGLKGSVCTASIENMDFQYHPDLNDDYLCPDIMIICDRKQIKGGAYVGIPKFIAEVLSPSTAKRDKTVKKDIYETAGVEEYWLVTPQGKSLEIYYLENGKYILEQYYILQNDKEDKEYNADTEICLKAFPHIKMTLEEIFEEED